MRTLRRPIRLVTALVVVVAFLLAAGFAAEPGGAFVLEPRLAVDPDFGPAGSTVQVAGAGFAPFPVLIGFSQGGVEHVLGMAGVGSDGSFTATVAVPADAALGPAAFFAENAGGRALAEFTVTDGDGDGGGEPIGDTPGPPPAKVPVCEVVIILEKVTNRLTSPAGTDRDRLRITSDSATPRLPELEGVQRTVEDVFVRGEETRVAVIIGRFRRPKSAFPTEVFVSALLRLLDGPYVVDPAGVNIPLARKIVKCEDSALLQTTVEVFTLQRTLLGQVELTYRVLVRELRDL